jgi:hypothetical protein
MGRDVGVAGWVGISVGAMTVTVAVAFPEQAEKAKTNTGKRKIMDLWKCFNIGRIIPKIKTGQQSCPVFND